MANKFVPNSAILTIHWLFNMTIAGYNVLGLVKPAGVQVTQTLANELDASIKAAFTSSALQAKFSLQARYVATSIRDYSSANLPAFVGSSGSVAGTDPGDALPYKDSCCISLKTAMAGTRYRGRVYLSGWSETQNDPNGLMVAAAQTAAIDFVVAVEGAIVGKGMQLGVLSRPSDKYTLQKTHTLPDGSTEVETQIREARPGAITPVTAIISRNLIWDSTRRRAGAGSASTFFANRNLVDLTVAREAPVAARSNKASA